MQINILDLGRVSFLDAFSEQVSIQEEVRKGNLADTLILCEHPHTITVSRKFKAENILNSELILDGSVDFIAGVNRGGDVTYHGPGQLMCYFIFDLRRLKRDLGLFINRIEDVIINTLAVFEIDSRKKYSFRGVWVDNKKIASIGLGVNKWVTIHGFGLNVNTDLRFFELIRPCGMDIEMISMNEIIGDRVDMGLVKEELVRNVKLKAQNAKLKRKTFSPLAGSHHGGKNVLNFTL